MSEAKNFTISLSWSFFPIFRDITVILLMLLLACLWFFPENYIILSTSRLSTYRINNATVKPITWLCPQINSSHSSRISHGWLNWFSTVKWSSNKQALPTWKGSDSHKTWTLCKWQIIPAGDTLFLTMVAGGCCWKDISCLSYISIGYYIK